MGILDVLFPPRCASCRGSGWPLCQECSREVGVITPPLCRRCGRPTAVPVARCADCPPPVIDAVRAPFLYDGAIARSIKAMKFSGWHALSRDLAGAMAAVIEPAADVVTWVPLSRRRRGRRGFDQAELLARGVGRRLDLPSRRLLRRVRDTAAQARLAGVDRRSALREAFASVRASPPSVILVDDVLTTGSTAAACAETVKEAGARRVVVLAVARSLNGPVPARCYRTNGPSLGADGPLEPGGTAAYH